MDARADCCGAFSGRDSLGISDNDDSEGWESERWIIDTHRPLAQMNEPRKMTEMSLPFKRIPLVGSVGSRRKRMEKSKVKFTPFSRTIE
ncbi:hypothetical protein AVEN_63148-1 [Araneus ventricosus]|uniref:Uncharacterized protein n=1 Tax=Araneus ventricosus TaxID=182803 RepID=A0A4Y2B2V7_ARAVE|nr:hypothetical protein AVEN_63148-1 [Araneus ventricosus]